LRSFAFGKLFCQPIAAFFNARAMLPSIQSPKLVKLRKDSVLPGFSESLTKPQSGEENLQPVSLVARIEKRYPTFTLDVRLERPQGITILFGASGAGKTTVLECLAGFVAPDAGHIQLGSDILFDNSTGVNLPPQQRGIGYVFQDLALFPHLTVRGNVEYGLHRLPRAERNRRSQTILQAFRIDALADRRPREISGGERQRVALARALVTDPCTLLLDEPLAALDAPTKSRIIEDLRQWNETHRIPILYVTHSREEVFSLGEHVVVMDAGRVIAAGAPHSVFSAPRIESVAQLAGFENIFRGVVESIHEERGTMICGLESGGVQLETPLLRAQVGEAFQIGIRAGDILLANQPPAGLSARNILKGRLISLERRDAIVMASVNCGVVFEVQLTLAARDALALAPGADVWLIVKTHSCHLLAG
jgi:molybdate transport system ATP-binding protein